MFWSTEESEVKAHLASIEPELHRIFQRAWKRLKTGVKEPLIFPRRSYPTIFHDLVTQEALNSLCELPGVKEHESHDSYFFVINQQVVLRFKKGNSFGMSSNYPTERAQSIQKGQLDLPGPGMKPQIFVEVVYQPDPLWTKIENILIVRRYGNTMLWQYAPRSEILPAPKALPQSVGPRPSGGTGAKAKEGAKLKKTREGDVDSE